MLFGEHTGGERFGRIGLKDRDRRLCDNRTFVQGRHNKMHRAAVDFDPIREGAFMRLQTPVGRQQRRVNV